MSVYTYKVIPAPVQGKRGKGAKGSAGRFANGLEQAINELASDGWEYLRAESLPSVERSGLTRRKVEAFQNVLVFRKIEDAAEAVGETEEKNPFFRPKRKPEPKVEEITEEIAQDVVEDVAEDIAEEAVEDVLEEAVETAVESTADAKA